MLGLSMCILLNSNMGERNMGYLEDFIGKFNLIENTEIY